MGVQEGVEEEEPGLLKAPAVHSSLLQLGISRLEMRAVVGQHVLQASRWSRLVYTLPGPEDVQVQALEDRGFRVTWKPSASPLWVQPEEYVVEWREELPSTNEALDWTRVPGSSGSTLLIGHFKPKLPYLVRVYALHSHGNSASAPTRAYFKEEAPSNSPQALRDRRISSAVCNVSWEEIPLVDRNGHITHYTLYLKQQDSVTSKLHKTSK
ncbi:Interleukin-27 receptor subunit alpha [Varanus komodoensis]|nr:Interleukin-27 receptor subunit alpha [Varanus komodoensis]